jgi:hypothetical protein
MGERLSNGLAVDRASSSQERGIFACTSQSGAARLCVAACTALLFSTACTESKSQPEPNRHHARGAPVDPDAPDELTETAADASFDATGPQLPAARTEVYVAKIKNLLVGLPATDAEVRSVARDPAELRALIDGWMGSPNYEAKLRRFFELAFQQRQITASDLAAQTYPDELGLNAYNMARLTRNTRERFARTMVALIARGEPLTAALTTREFMLTTALKELRRAIEAGDAHTRKTLRTRAASRCERRYTTRCLHRRRQSPVRDLLDIPRRRSDQHPRARYLRRSEIVHSKDYGALPTASKTGRGVAGGDIDADRTLASFGKTILAAVGVDQPTRDAVIRVGSVIEPALG